MTPRACQYTLVFVADMHALNSESAFAAGPVLDLSFLIDHVMMDIKPLHWGDVISSDVPLKVGQQKRKKPTGGCAAGLCRSSCQEAGGKPNMSLFFLRVLACAPVLLILLCGNLAAAPFPYVAVGHEAEHKRIGMRLRQALLGPVTAFGCDHSAGCT